MAFNLVLHRRLGSADEDLPVLVAVIIRGPALIVLAVEMGHHVAGARLTNEVQFLYDRELQWEQNIITSI